jgi:hypothetical protein
VIFGVVHGSKLSAGENIRCAGTNGQGKYDDANFGTILFLVMTYSYAMYPTSCKLFVAYRPTSTGECIDARSSGSRKNRGLKKLTFDSILLGCG